ncbi:MAG: hypothetical protein HOA04_06205 [Euryarchaeota archaeon]|nr:hypothetical protein [Euryarchaeota archaeon]
MTGTTMVEIQCPHCEEDIELEDGVFGLFDCPHCNNEFEFEDDSTNIGISIRPKIGVIILLVFSLLFAIGAGLIYWSTSFGDADGDGLNDECVESSGWFCDGSLEKSIAGKCISISGVIILLAILRYAFQQSIRLVEFNRGKTE